MAKEKHDLPNLAETLRCPLCGDNAELQEIMPDGQFLCVAQFLACSTEVYDQLVLEYKCSSKKQHVFYVSAEMS